MGLTYQQAKDLGLAHLWPTESKAPPIVRPLVSAAPDDGMNKLERAFHELLKAGDQGDVYREGITLRLAGRTRYTPDFVSVVLLLGLPPITLTCWEVKGGWFRDDAAVKLKVAAEMYPAFRFVLVTRPRRVWQCRYVTSRGISRETWIPDWLR